MKTTQENKEDILREFFSTESIEKAPEGFTANIMSRIQVEPATVEKRVRAARLKMVPLVSAAIVVLLVVMAVLLPDKSSTAATGPAFDLVKKISLMLPSVDAAPHIKLNIPATFIYISVAVFMLSFFDRALNGIFHRDK